MKYLKTQEEISQEQYDEYFNFEDDIERCGYYIVSLLPKENFFDWQFVNDIDNIIENNVVQFEFFYDEDIEEDELVKILNIFDIEKLSYYMDYDIHSLAGHNIKKQTKFTTHINKDKILEFSKFYNSIVKYNL